MKNPTFMAVESLNLWVKAQTLPPSDSKSCRWNSTNNTPGWAWPWRIGSSKPIGLCDLRRSYWCCGFGIGFNPKETNPWCFWTVSVKCGGKDVSELEQHDVSALIYVQRETEQWVWKRHKNQGGKAMKIKPPHEETLTDESNIQTMSIFSMQTCSQFAQTPTGNPIATAATSISSLGRSNNVYVPGIKHHEVTCSIKPNSKIQNHQTGHPRSMVPWSNFQQPLFDPTTCNQNVPAPPRPVPIKIWLKTSTVRTGSGPVAAVHLFGR